ncbi:transposase [Saccharicrinis fermentans]|nr:transposase [Saccharicrinis fermentans]
MANPKLPLEPDQFYHIYNRGINGCAIFKETTNYEHFLRLYDKYISPVAKTFAWVLMGNHFHLLVYITKPVGIEDLRPLDVKKRINQQFSNLFNAYTKAFNKRYKRTGSLFEHSFRRKRIDTKDYLRQVVLYIHNNPVHHNFCEHPIEYPWSSYLSCVSAQSTKLNRDAVIGWFDHQANFKLMHNKKLNFENFEKWLDL